MIATFALGALLFAQSGPAILSSDAVESNEVSYEALQSGEAARAIAELESLRETNPDDPALLINLGSAYAQAGDSERAAEVYRAAIASDVRYRLELANGDWVDSRHAARLALRALEGSAMALR